MTEQFDEQGRPVLVKVIAHDYVISWKDDGWRYKEEHRGQCDGNTQEIIIVEQLPPSQIAETFLHEIMHALSFVLRPADELSIEQCAVFFGPLLVAFWRDNPRTFAWWSALIQGVRA